MKKIHLKVKGTEERKYGLSIDFQGKRISTKNEDLLDIASATIDWSFVQGIQEIKITLRKALQENSYKIFEDEGL